MVPSVLCRVVSCRDVLNRNGLAGQQTCTFLGAKAILTSSESRDTQSRDAGSLLSSSTVLFRIGGRGSIQYTGGRRLREN
jgi:hypothetical protein